MTEQSIPRVPLPTMRAAVADDAQPIVDLRDDLARWITAGGIRQWDEGDLSPTEVGDGIARGEWHVAEVDRRVAACVRLVWSDAEFWGDDDAPAGYVHGLMVDRAHAGHGWGRAMVEWCVDRTRDAGYDVIRLDTAAHNPTLVAYYRSLGFDPVRETDLPARFGRDMRVVLFERAV
ncbi:GNAT family N-acetyltransferase [Williamsia herbipolensis]|uniref:GNAT family N-acetyltransferase n=1 Tax=Williamsia herbipolensis TaxID=1603258 RepID=A0AAU4K5K9_9NOCA|nr:GNAT family N-acetyltransferase [Williamsia herbipolensis]